jgi:uncharacterized protein
MIWENPEKNKGEARFLVIEQILDKLWSAVISFRNTNIGLISVLCSRTE